MDVITVEQPRHLGWGDTNIIEYSRLYSNLNDSLGRCKRRHINIPRS